METHQVCCDDIVTEILMFLPVKSLMRFKCVCKVWNTLITHPNFVRSHYACSRDRPSGSRFLFQLAMYQPKEEYYEETTSESKGFSLQLDYFVYDQEMSICSNHCNGLVCLYNYKDTQVYLYNVTTREIKALPPSVSRRVNIKRYAHPHLFLGFDQVTEKYKLLYFFPPGEKVAKILTLGVTNTSWRKIGLHNYTPVFSSSACVFLNGVLYWTDISIAFVVYINVVEEIFGYIPRPPQTWFETPCMITQLTTFWGKLAMHCYHIDGPVLLVYDEANKVFNVVERKKTMEVAVSLLGAERISDKTKDTHVLATSVINAPAASLLSSSRLRFFVEHNNNKKSPRIMFTYVSSFVENIIPLTSLLV